MKNMIHNSITGLANQLMLGGALHDDSLVFIKEESVNYDEPLIKFTDNVLNHAIQQSASDVHIEPYEDNCRIRYRLDGLLREIAEIPSQLATRLVARLKILAKLDISERRLPQDGRFQFYQHDIRINSCPTLFGEKVVLRILNTGQSTYNIASLGFLDSQLTLFKEKISQPQGLILVTGPTGSGKTNTLYTALDYLNTPEKNISTVEDPIEIQLKGINQINIHPKIGLNFATILRSLLRQDPDIIMVGEIRDEETAGIAIQAAQTGHLVFSTLHTNSAADTFTRLKSMNIPEYNLANSISLIIAQRLIRKLCDYCKLPDNLSSEDINSLGLITPQTEITIFRANNCEHCINGYHTRTAIYELMTMNEYKTHNFISLRQSATNKVIQGISSIAEINRVLQK